MNKLILLFFFSLPLYAQVQYREQCDRYNREHVGVRDHVCFARRNGMEYVPRDEAVLQLDSVWGNDSCVMTDPSGQRSPQTIELPRGTQCVALPIDSTIQNNVYQRQLARYAKEEADKDKECRRLRGNARRDCTRQLADIRSMNNYRRENEAPTSTSRSRSYQLCHSALNFFEDWSRPSSRYQAFYVTTDTSFFNGYSRKVHSRFHSFTSANVTANISLTHDETNEGMPGMGQVPEDPSPVPSADVDFVLTCRANNAPVPVEGEALNVNDSDRVSGKEILESPESSQNNGSRVSEE